MTATEIWVKEIAVYVYAVFITWDFVHIYYE